MPGHRPASGGDPADRLRARNGDDGRAANVHRKGKLKDVLAQVEREMILQALAENDGNRTRAAEALGMSRWGLVQKIKAYDIDS